MTVWPWFVALFYGREKTFWFLFRISSPFRPPFFAEKDRSKSPISSTPSARCLTNLEPNMIRGLGEDPGKLATSFLWGLMLFEGWKFFREKKKCATNHLYWSNPTKSSKAHECGRNKPKKKNRERGDAFGANDVYAVEELHLFHWSLDQTESENLKVSKFFLTIPTKSNGGVFIQPQMSAIISFGFFNGFWSAFGYHHQHWLRQHAILLHV